MGLTLTRGCITDEGKGNFRWNLPPLLILDALVESSRRSPEFSFGKCSWYLELQYCGSSLKASLKRRCRGPEVVGVTVTLGIWKSDKSAKKTFTRHFGEHCRSTWVDDTVSVKSRDWYVFCLLYPHSVTCCFESHSLFEVREELQWERRRVQHLESLASDFRQLLTRGEMSDVVLNVQGRKFHSHRLLLAARSPVFRATFSHDSEGTGVVEIPDCDPESFSHFLQFLYCGKIEKLMSRDTVVGLHEIADKYDVQALKSFCSDLLNVSLTPENVCDCAVNQLLQKPLPPKDDMANKIIAIVVSLVFLYFLGLYCYSLIYN